MNRILTAIIVVFATVTGVVMTSARAQMVHLSPETVVATRGGVDLTLALVDQEMSKMPDEVRSGYLEDPERFGRLVDSLLLTRQLAAEAVKQGLSLPEDASAQGEQNESLDYYNKLAGELLKRQGAVKSDADYELLASEQYLARKSKYASEERFTLRRFHANPTQGPIAAKIMAEAVRARVLAGEHLAQLRNELPDGSDEVSDEITLSLGEVLRAGPLLGQALSQIGRRTGVSEVLEDENGVHLIEVVHYFPPVVPPFEDVKDRLVEDLKAEAIANEKTTYLRSFSLLDITLNNPVISVLPERYRSGGKNEEFGGVFH